MLPLDSWDGSGVSAHSAKSDERGTERLPLWAGGGVSAQAGEEEEGRRSWLRPRARRRE